MADHYLTNPRPPSKGSTMIDDVMLEAEDKMDKALQAAKSELATIRTGRANPSMFNGIVVDYYGAPTPLQQLASLTIPEARTVLVSPFDRSAMKDIVTAIRESDLGVNPTDDGTVIRVTLPALTEERRKDYVKLARSRAEDVAAAIIRAVHGEPVLSARPTEILVNAYQSERRRQRTAQHMRYLVEQLPPRLQDVHARLLRGLTNHQIAEDLDISENTVRIYVSDVLHHLGHSSRTELLAAALI